MYTHISYSNAPSYAEVMTVCCLASTRHSCAGSGHAGVVDAAESVEEPFTVDVSALRREAAHINFTWRVSPHPYHP